MPCSEQRLHPTIMVGDGINDAPALASAMLEWRSARVVRAPRRRPADAAILADRLDRVGDAITIAQRARRIAVESIVAGMSLSVCDDCGYGRWLAPVPWRIQEVIDVVADLNALGL